MLDIIFDNVEECSGFFLVLLINPRQGNLDLMQLSQFKSTFGKARAWYYRKIQ